MRLALLSCLVACSFRAGSATKDGAADGKADGKPDGKTGNTVCHVGVADRVGSDNGKVGLSIGGGTNKPLACAATDLIVGIALDMSNGNVNGGDTRSAHGIRIGCAAVTIDASGGHTGSVTTVDVIGFGSAGFTPSTMTALAQCPDGAVVAGLQIHGSHYTSLFLDAVMTCMGLDVNGGVSNTTQMYIPGSLVDGMHASEVQCGQDEQVVSMETDIGAGLDSLHLYCSPTICN